MSFAGQLRPGATKPSAVGSFFEDFFIWLSLGVELEQGLPRSQFRQQLATARRAQQRHRTQQHHRIGQQTHAPCQPQAVEKELAQTQLVLLERLRGFNPRANLVQEALGGLSAQRQQAQQRLMLAGGVSKLSRTLGRLPAAGTQRSRVGYAKPMAILAGEFRPAFHAQGCFFGGGFSANRSAAGANL